jgi:hypothetical protein
LRDGFSVKETAHLLNIRPSKVEAIRARHHLPFNNPIRPGTRAERDAVNLLIFFRGEPHPDLCDHLSQAPANLVKLRDRIT